MKAMAAASPVTEAEERRTAATVLVIGTGAAGTLECALERRETRGAHNRVDFPQQDPALQANLVWAADGTIAREPIPQPSPAVAALAGGPELDVRGRLLE
jgi:succinate dehydrogenase / fumarate reductase, flavoprotein subunit